MMYSEQIVYSCFALNLNFDFTPFWIFVDQRPASQERIVQIKPNKKHFESAPMWAQLILE